MASNPLDTHVCHCGTCRGALDAALKLFQETDTAQCLHWYAALVSAHHAILAVLIEMDATGEFVENGQRISEALATDESVTYLIERVNAVIEKSGSAVN